MLNEKNEKLRQECVAHWIDMRDNPDSEDIPGPGDCAFCREYLFTKNYLTGLQYCDGCPIKEKTGLNFCKGTPYGKASKSFWYNSSSWEADATEMIQFLQDL